MVFEDSVICIMGLQHPSQTQCKGKWNRNGKAMLSHLSKYGDHLLHIQDFFFNCRIFCLLKCDNVFIQDKLKFIGIGRNAFHSSVFYVSTFSTCKWLSFTLNIEHLHICQRTQKRIQVLLSFLGNLPSFLLLHFKKSISNLLTTAEMQTSRFKWRKLVIACRKQN